MSSEGMGQRTGAATGSDDLKERTVETVAEVDAAAMHVAGVTGDEAKHVAHEAKSAARGFFEETRMQVAEQASTQQRRAAEALRSAGEELSDMAGSAQSGGMAVGLVRGLGRQTSNAASWLEQREPADLVQEMRGFARRHTGMFLVAALGVGIVAGRLTRALASGQGGSGQSGSGRSGVSGMGMSGAAQGAQPLDAAGYGGYATGGGVTTGVGSTGVGATGGSATGVGATTGMGAGGSAGDTPIGDSLAGDPQMGDPLASGGSAQQGLGDADEPGGDAWSPGGEGQR